VNNPSAFRLDASPDEKAGPMLGSRSGPERSTIAASKDSIAFAELNSFSTLNPMPPSKTEVSSTPVQSLAITVADTQQVSGLLQVPADARACYVFAHGAGAGMTHSFMVAVADGLAERGIATLRYQF